MTHNRSRFVAALALTLAGTPGMALPAAPPSPEPPAQAAGLTERASVELVLIEVYVTDAAGRPVKGLTADNFSLMVDGHAKPIHSLEFREAASAGVPPARGDGPAPSDGQGDNLPAQPARRFVLFFEDATSAPQGLTAARQAARRFLASGLLPGDQVAIASFDRKLRFLRDFTTDRTALLGAIESSLSDLKRFTGTTSEQALWETKYAELVSRVGRAEGSGEILTASTAYADEFTPRSRDVLRALKTLVDSLSHYPGYKAILFMGDGVPENPAVDFLQRFGPTVPASQYSSRLRKYDLSLEIQMLARDAAAAGVTLHSVLTTGQTSASGPEMRATGRRSNALETLALNTGGTKSTSNDLLKGLAAAEDAARAYYLLGYAPEGPPDGKDHTVQLRLKHASGQLRWRRGFTRFVPEEARRRAVEAAYALPDLASDLGVEISVVPGPADASGRVYDLVLHVSPGGAMFVAQPDGASATLEAGFVVIDEGLREVTRAARLARIAVRGGARQSDLGVDFFSRIHAPRGAQTITAVVSDRTSGVLGAARLAIPEVANSRSSIVGLSIYSLSEHSLWIEIPPGRESPTRDDSATTEYKVGPALKSTFAIGEPVACAFRIEGTAGSDGLRLAIRRDGKEVRATEVGGKETSKGTVAAPGAVEVRLPMDGLAAGDYELVVLRRDPGGGESIEGATPLRLRPGLQEPFRARP